MEQHQNGVTIDLGNHDVLVLQHVKVVDLEKFDFLL